MGNKENETAIKKEPLAEVLETNIAQFNDPVYQALVLALENGEISFNTYISFCEDFNFKIL